MRKLIKRYRFKKKSDKKERINVKSKMSEED
jgi:hypothetical protein